MAAAAAPVLKMEMGAFYIPKRNPSKPLGEDAHFVFSDKQAAGVADGVGAWAFKGIDAGEYARELMTNCAAVIAAADGAAPVSPRRVLMEAHSRTTAAGSSTACVICLHGEFLRAANLGDSGFMIFRKGRMVYESPAQQWGFNCPYQMGNGEQCDKPAAAWRGKIRVAAGDVVVVGTDGVLDNVFAREIEEILKETTKTAEDLATVVAALALRNSLDKNKDGPFAVAAREAGRRHRGGKIDDITVIVAKITATN